MPKISQIQQAVVATIVDPNPFVIAAFDFIMLTSLPVSPRRLLVSMLVLSVVAVRCASKNAFLKSYPK
jgi:hypothetical protein